MFCVECLLTTQEDSVIFIGRVKHVHLSQCRLTVILVSSSCLLKKCWTADRLGLGHLYGATMSCKALCPFLVTQNQLQYWVCAQIKNLMDILLLLLRIIITYYYVYLFSGTMEKPQLTVSSQVVLMESKVQVNCTSMSNEHSICTMYKDGETLYYVRCNDFVNGAQLMMWQKTSNPYNPINLTCVNEPVRNDYIRSQRSNSVPVLVVGW